MKYTTYNAICLPLQGGPQPPGQEVQMRTILQNSKIAKSNKRIMRGWAAKRGNECLSTFLRGLSFLRCMVYYVSHVWSRLGVVYLSVPIPLWYKDSLLLRYFNTSRPKLLWALRNLPLLETVWEWPPDPKGPGQWSFENIPRFGPEIGTLGTPGGSHGTKFFTSKFFSCKII